MVMVALVPAGWALADDVSVVISELATTGVEAGARSITVRVTVHYDHLEIGLTHDEAAPTPVETPESDAVATRRAILAALTTRVRTLDLGAQQISTEVEMRCDPQHTTRVPCVLRPRGSAGPVAS
jgi:hypothetical protein